MSPPDGADEFSASRAYSYEEFERMVESRARQREQEKITKSLEAAQKSLEDRIQQMSSEVQTRLAGLHDDLSRQTREMQDRYRQLVEEQEKRTRQFHLDELTPPEIAGTPALFRFWNTYSAMLEAMVRREMTRNLVAEQRTTQTTKVSRTVKLVGGIAAAVLTVGTIVGWVVVWLGHHLK